jgi:hypothetical protein
VIAEILSEEEIMGLKEIFKSMDIDNSGTITFDELKIGLARLGSKVSESEVRQLMDAVRTYEFSFYTIDLHDVDIGQSQCFLYIFDLVVSRISIHMLFLLIILGRCRWEWDN